MDQSRLLLDQFFGVDRNLSIRERNKRREHYTDKEVCVYFLVSTDECYKELFPNTAHDDGGCNQRHDEFFKRQFQDDLEERRAEFEYEITKQAIDYIQKKINEIDHKIQKNKQYTEKKIATDVERPKEIQQKIDNMESQIKIFLEQSANLGAQGEIEQSEKLAEQAEALRIQKDQLIAQTDNGLVNGNLAQKQVCDICGAWKITNDNDKRAQTHLEGKIHQGFQYLRDEIIRLKDRKNVLKAILKKIDKEKERKRHQKSRTRSRSRSKNNKKGHSQRQRNDFRSNSKNKKSNKESKNDKNYKR